MLCWPVMEFFTIAPDDRRFLVRSMRCHLAIWMVIGLVFTIGSLVPSHSPYAASSAGAASSANATGSANTAGPIASVSVAVDEDAFSTDAHVPVGWRRTANGWENTSNWLSPHKSIDTWIEEQTSREPAWAQRTMAIIRNTPPLVFAMLQVLLITAVVLITTRKKLMVKSETTTVA